MSAIKETAFRYLVDHRDTVLPRLLPYKILGQINLDNVVRIQQRSKEIFHRLLPIIVCANHISLRDPVDIYLVLKELRDQDLIGKLVCPVFDDQTNQGNAVFTQILAYFKQRGLVEPVGVVQSHLQRCDKSLTDEDIKRQIDDNRRRAIQLNEGFYDISAQLNNGQGTCLVIFPDGHRSILANHGLQPAEIGIFNLIKAIQDGGIVLPVGLYYKGQADRGLNPFKTMFVNVGAPLPAHNVCQVVVNLRQNYSLQRREEVLVPHAVMFLIRGLIPRSMWGVYDERHPAFFDVLNDRVKLGIMGQTQERGETKLQIGLARIK